MEIETIIRKYCYRAAIMLFAGILISGIPANLVANAIAPQPKWVDIETYAAHFRPIQLLPIWGGFVMLSGFLGLVAGIYFSSAGLKKLDALLALVCATIYGTLISLNYILQLGVLQPALMNNNYKGMEMLLFTNPYSVTMSIEMLGYCFQGLATFFIIPVFDNSNLGRWIKSLTFINVAVSIAGLLLQGLNIPMALDKPAGMIGFIGWNMVFTVLCLLYVVYFRKAKRQLA